MGLYVWCVDLPLSAAADTVTLPVTVASSMGSVRPDPGRGKESLAALGRSVKETSQGLVQKLPYLGESSSPSERTATSE
jgi:hypothetical protein